MKNHLSILAIAITCSFIIGCQKSSPQNQQVNKGRELVMQSIEAHGGKDKWYNSGLLQFRWIYHMTDRGPKAIVDSVQTVDTKNMNVMHEVPGKDIRFGMNAGKTWIEPKGASFAPPPNFWSLTPFYFIGMPFVFNDDNANFELLSETKAFEGINYTQVKVTYNPGSGDTPDDYYVLLIDPDTKLTVGAYYIVTSPIIAKDGPTPPKFISLDNLTEIGGVKLAAGHRTFKMTDGVIGEQMRFVKISGVKFVPKQDVDLSIPSEDLIIK